MEVTPFTAYSATTGQVLFSGEAGDPAALEDEGRIIMIGQKYEHGWIDEELEHQLPPAQPSVHHVFNWATKTWEDPRTLDDLKAQQWTLVKAARDALEFGTFTWDGSVFDCDQTSQQRIQGAAQLATLAQLAAQPFEIDWTLHDNSVRTLDASDMIAVGTAMGTHVSTLHATGRILRAAIEAATTKEEVEAVVWT